MQNEEAKARKVEKFKEWLEATTDKQMYIDLFAEAMAEPTPTATKMLMEHLLTEKANYYAQLD